MPVLKIKNNGVWEQVGGIPDHTHVIDDITDFPTSLPANGGNADTVDGKHASDFASAAEMTTVQNDINDINTMLNGIEIPTTLPNPNALRFTGAINASYDGSSEVNVEIPQSDWNQNDPTGSGYIKNRPFYTDYDYITLFEDLTGSADYKHGPMDEFDPPYNDFVSLLLPESFLIEKGDNLLVEIDGKKYNVTADCTDYAPKVTYVNGYFPYFWGNTTEESPFHISPYTEFHPDSNSSIESGRYYFTMAFTNEPPKTLSIKKVSENIVKIPNEYLPETTYVDYSKAQELTDEQKSQARTNIGVETLDISGKMDKNNPTGTGSFSLNRKPGTVVGANSHAEGSDATASGWYSHAEGRDTTASNDCSHAEGDYTTASGNNSHAEGSMTSASGGYSHAEGQDTTASGERSHAEGQGTSASGTGSHTEGYYTKASSSYQHTQGKYNIEDSSDVYADIIGNGTKSKPSNAATVDWHGNAWYAGDVYVGSTSGTNKDEGSKKLATEEYVDNSVIVPAPSSADNGKYLGCENGAAKWMPVEASGGGAEEEWETICEIVGFNEDLHMYEVNGANGPVYKKIHLTVYDGSTNTVFAFCGRGKVLPDIYSGTDDVIAFESILSAVKNPTAYSARIEKDDIGVYTQVYISSGVGSTGNATPIFEPIGYGMNDNNTNRFRNVYKLGGIQNIRIYQNSTTEPIPTGMKCRILGVRA